MIKLDVLRETSDRDGYSRAFTVSVWFDADEISTVQADTELSRKAKWSLVTFKANTNRRAMVVEGEAETVAEAIGAEQDRQRQVQRRPLRRVRN